MTTILLVLALFSGQSLALLWETSSSECDNCCWQKCFSNPGNYSAEYARLHSMVTTLIAQKQTLGTGGTAFLFDYTTADPNVCAFQKNLASLIALTMPVEDVCNPFFFNKNTYNLAWYASSWQCKDRCKAATSITDSGDCITAPRYPIPNWINAGCNLADHAFNNPSLSCSRNVVKKREIVIALANSPFRMLGSPPFGDCINPPQSSASISSGSHPGFTRAILGVDNADVSQMEDFASNPLLSFDFKHMDGSEAQAAIKQLLECINDNCCDGAENTPAERQAEEGQAWWWLFLNGNSSTIIASNPRTPIKMTENEAKEFINDILNDPPTMTESTSLKPTTSTTTITSTTTTANSCKPNKKCTKKRGKCYKTPPSKNCKKIGHCSKNSECKCYKC